jgi:uncharacterized protein (TIGR02646 family)
MIRIERPANGPPSLKKFGDRQTEDDCAAYEACPSDYICGVKRFTQRIIYRSRPVKTLLFDLHHGKCCYCETRLPPEHLHVEHFRPRGGVRQELDQEEDELPGYYWLAYRWENLLLACFACNSSHKKTFFPLANPENRARSHNDDVTRERALFVDPVVQNPRLHITFEYETPDGQTPEGRKTIEGLGLRRARLREDRLEKLSHINAFLWFLEAAAARPTDADLQAKAEVATKFIKCAKLPEAEFSSMVTDYVTPLGF